MITLIVFLVCMLIRKSKKNNYSNDENDPKKKVISKRVTCILLCLLTLSNSMTVTSMADSTSLSEAQISYISNLQKANPYIQVEYDANYNSSNAKSVDSAELQNYAKSFNLDAQTVSIQKNTISFGNSSNNDVGVNVVDKWKLSETAYIHIASIPYHAAFLAAKFKYKSYYNTNFNKWAFLDIKEIKNWVTGITIGCDVEWDCHYKTVTYNKSKTAVDIKFDGTVTVHFVCKGFPIKISYDKSFTFTWNAIK